MSLFHFLLLLPHLVSLHPMALRRAAPFFFVLCQSVKFIWFFFSQLSWERLSLFTLIPGMFIWALIESFELFLFRLQSLVCLFLPRKLLLKWVVIKVIFGICKLEGTLMWRWACIHWAGKELELMCKASLQNLCHYKTKAWKSRNSPYFLLNLIRKKLFFFLVPGCAWIWQQLLVNMRRA